VQTAHFKVHSSEFRVWGVGRTVKCQLSVVNCRKSFGFTLIELLIVIAILGILAAAVLVAINPGKRTRQAQDAKRKNDIGALATELQAFYTAPGLGCYPTALTTLQTQGFVKQLPKDVTGNQYSYVTGAAGAGCAAPAGPTEVGLYATMGDPTGTGTRIWCWTSTGGTAQEVTNTLCTAP